ncbi:hypothetical protein FPV67DRAFT_1411676 [Lyophyllum atratum]|nr:hypothetical protein FPV67DRAFT_1411676 [Lyophyllum atratum]
MPPLFLTSVVRADIEKNTTLCLACASSLPPLKKSSTAATGIFTTPCCQRPICPSCIATNPRLPRYDPCLACLEGVNVVRTASLAGSTPHSAARSNVDGVVRDEDTFVLGDEEDDSDLDDEICEKPTVTTNASPLLQDVTSPIASQETLQTDNTYTPAASENTTPGALAAEEQTLAGREIDSTPVKYYVTRSDTLQGIVLRYGLDGYELCRLNNLPPSTLRTTPHLLHTRRFLLLPPSVRRTEVPLNPESPEQAREREASHGKERAEKRLQMLTKEVDWRVAKAYVALADDPDEAAEEREEWDRKRKESSGEGVGAGPLNLEERAIRKYLDDEEWEER